MSPGLIAVGISLIIVLLIVGIFFLCDDKDDIIKRFRDTTWRLWRDVSLAVLILVIFNGGSMSGRLLVTSTEKLWNPYIFCGMPSYAVGNVGVKWWNQIQITLDTSLTLLFVNPIMFGLFLGSTYWLYRRFIAGKKMLKNYILVLSVEVIMLFTTNWSY